MFLLRGLAYSYRSDIAVEREIGYGIRISGPTHEIIRVDLRNKFLVRVAGWMQEYRKYTLANYTGMIRSNCQFLTNITTFSEVHYPPLNDKGEKIRQNDVHPPIISILDSMGKAFIGIMSVLPSGTPSAILCSR